jgi:hypothetical protein
MSMKIYTNMCSIYARMYFLCKRRYGYTCTYISVHVYMCIVSGSNMSVGSISSKGTKPVDFKEIAIYIHAYTLHIYIHIYISI